MTHAALSQVQSGTGVCPTRTPYAQAPTAPTTVNANDDAKGNTNDDTDDDADDDAENSGARAPRRRQRWRGDHVSGSSALALGHMPRLRPRPPPTSLTTANEEWAGSRIRRRPCLPPRRVPLPSNEGSSQDDGQRRRRPATPTTIDAPVPCLCPLTRVVGQRLNDDDAPAVRPPSVHLTDWELQQESVLAPALHRQPPPTSLTTSQPNDAHLRLQEPVTPLPPPLT
ncbi:hypothetical protein BJ912DRAFT_1056539 [Pholiota molesta]|nr:hypothetical protein BJ912DRAFT_1056539 [Pholiota molesta]